MKSMVNPSSALAQSDLGEFVGAFRFPLRTILSFEFALVLLISVGAWKANPTFAWMFPIDATLIMAAVCGIIFLKYLFMNGFPRRLVTAVAFYFVFCLWTVASVIWTKAAGQMPLITWISRIFVVNGVIFLGTLVVVAQSRARTIRFLAALCLVALILGIDYVIQARTLRSLMAKFEDIQYNLNGEIVALAFGTFFAFMLYTKMFTPRWILCVLAMCVLLYSSLIIGSRQSFLAGIIQIMVAMAFAVYTRNRSLQLQRGAVPALVLLILCAFAVLLLLQSGFQSRLMTRLGGLTEYVSGDPGGDRSAGTRMVFMAAAVNFWTDSPFTMMFGNGLFGYSTLLKGAYFLGAHPHNLVLNILTEFGLIGLLLYLGFVGSVVLGKGRSGATITPLNGILWGMALGEIFRALVDTRIESSGTFLMSMCLLAALRVPLHVAGPSLVGRSRRPTAEAVSHPA
jgi:hypothetical protein